MILDKDTLLRYNRITQEQLPAAVDCLLAHLIPDGFIAFDEDLALEYIVLELTKYRIQHKINTVVIGMSGGIDSTLTAALFKCAGWIVVGVMMPIHQNPIENTLGRLAAEKFCSELIVSDLTEESDLLVKNLGAASCFSDSKSNKVREGNIRARLRMITLYNLAHRYGGIVGSTDNFSEYSVGFWTLHGDVGDVAPIQALNKSWEVPMLATHLHVPNKIIGAIPTDGLGITTSDEESLGFSYLELDLSLLSFHLCYHKPPYDIKHQLLEFMESDSYKKSMATIRRTRFKRNNPVNFAHPFFNDKLYNALSKIK